MEEFTQKRHDVKQTNTTKYIQNSTTNLKGGLSSGLLAALLAV